MEIKIKMYDKRYEKEVFQFVDKCSDKEYLQHILIGSKLTCAYMASNDNQISGVVIAWTNNYHPNCTYFRILMNPSDRWQAIAKKLLLNLNNDPLVRKPLQTSMWESDEQFQDFYKTNGFIEIRKTYMPTLNITDHFFPEQNDLHDYILKTITDIAEDEEMLKKLTRLVKEIYEQTHIDNPVAELSLADWKNLILADDLVMSGSLVYLDGNEQNIIAYSFLHDSNDEERLELGWCGSKTEYHMQLIPQLVLLQIKYAQESGVRYIIGEFDTTSAYAMKVYKDIPFPSSISWVTYQLY